MRRKVFDLLASVVGLVMVIALGAAGGLLWWGKSFAESNVHNQLAQQEIFFPSKAALNNAKPGTEVTPEMVPYLMPYAGQQVLTGAQAEAYADHFIAVHLYNMPYHGVYSQVSAAARAATPGTPKAATLNALETTVFQGTTLRGLLLEAYAFGTFGTIAFWSAIISWILAAVMAVFVGFGFWHAAQTPAEMELLGRKEEKAA